MDGDGDDESGATRGDPGPSQRSQATLSGGLDGPGPAALELGAYEDLGPIAAGGWGEVRRVRDPSLGRTLAQKRLRPELRAAPQATARFLDEARLTAWLAHPGVAPVHALGRDADGWFFTMREITGLTLAAAIAAHFRGEPAWPQTRLVEGFRRMCETMAFAHAAGVVHRDLKPGNVLLGSFGEVFVVDWGVARILGRPDPRAGGMRPEVEQMRGQTRDGTMLGTPRYMSPEQAAGRLEAIDRRSDVWSLGAVLYEILSGRPAVLGEDLDSIRATLAAGRRTPTREAAPTAPAELAAIAERALAHDPADRYPSAAELAHDLGSWLAGARVRAHRYTARELGARFVREHRGPLMVAAAAAVLLAALSIGWAVQVRTERDRALTAEAASASSERRSRHSVAALLGERALATLDQGLTTDAALHAATALASAEDPVARGVLIAADDGPRRLAVAAPGGTCLGFAWSMDGRTLGCGVWKTGAVTWEPATGRLDVQPEEGGAILVRWSRDGRLRLHSSYGREVDVIRDAAGDPHATHSARGPGWILGMFIGASHHVLSGGGDGLVRRWDAHTGAEVAQWSLESPVAGLELDAAGTRAVTLDGLGRIFQWDPWTGARLGSIGEPTPTVRGIALAPDGRWLVGVGGAGGRPGLRLWDLADGHEIVAPHVDEPVVLASWSADSQRLAILETSGVVRTWSAPTWRAERSFRATTDAPVALALDHDGGRVAVGNDLGRMSVWDLRAALPALPTAGLVVRTLAVAADGRRVVVLADGSVRAWIAADAAPVLATAGEPDAAELAILADGSLLVFGPGPALRRLDPHGRELGRLPLEFTGVTDIAVTPDGRTAAVAGDAATVAVIDIASGARRADLGDPGRPIRHGTRRGWATTFTADARLLVSTFDDGTALVHDGTSLALVHTLDLGSPAYAVAGSPDGRLLAFSTYDGPIRLIAVDGWIERPPLIGHQGSSGCVAFAPGGRLLASGGVDRRIRLWNVDDGRLRAVIPAGDAPVHEVAFVPDEQALLAVLRTGEVRRFDLAQLDLTPAPALVEIEARTGWRHDGTRVVNPGATTPP